MAQSKKSPAKSATKSTEPRKAEKAAQAKKPAVRATAPKAAKPTAARAPAAKTLPAAKSKPVKPAAAKVDMKSKAAAPAAAKSKVKSEVIATNKKNPAPARPVPAKAAPQKPAPATAKAQPKAAPAKAVNPPAAAQAARKGAVKAPVAPAAAPKAAAPAGKAPAGLVAAVRAKAPAAPATRAMPAAVHKSAARMMTAPSMPVLPAQPTMPRAAAANPKELALKAAEARRQQMLAPKKPVNQRHGFKIGESIVYPAHGVGQIVGIEEQEIAGMSLELFVIQIEKDKLTLRVPTARLEAAGIRKLAEDNIVARAMETLKGRARIKRTMWSRRAQEYEAKINSGDLISIAEVVRDLYRSETQPEQSYSERQLYESALDRMAREIAVVDKLDERTAMQRITEVLSRSARGRRVAEETSGDTQAA
jgi:CarD family transcriptional regulator